VTVEDRGHRWIAAVAIVSAHAALVAALLFVRPQLEPRSAEPPIEVRFVSSPEPEHRDWQPPKVQTIMLPEIKAPTPVAPSVESVTVSATEHVASASAQSVISEGASEKPTVPKVISTVEYVREPLRRYPPQSRKLREQGLVVLRVLIDESGAPCSVEVETSSGHERLDRAAREAVSRAAFRPYVEDGLPRRAFVLIPIEFSLSRNSA